MTAEEYFEKGCEAYENGDYEGAIEYYSKAIALDPTLAVVYYNRGLIKTYCLMKGGNGLAGNNLKFDIFVRIETKKGSKNHFIQDIFSPTFIFTQRNQQKNQNFISQKVSRIKNKFRENAQKVWWIQKGAVLSPSE